MNFVKALFIMCMCCMLIACNKLTMDNFDKIQTNMTHSEVVSILGQPTSSDSVSIGGVTGTSDVWKNKDVEITIQFLNGKVLLKTYTNEGKKKD